MPAARSGFDGFVDAHYSSPAAVGGSAVPFALPLRLQTSGRANVREGPGANFKVLYTLETGVPIVAYSFVDQWVRITDASDRPGWIHQTLIDRRQ